MQPTQPDQPNKAMAFLKRPVTAPMWGVIIAILFVFIVGHAIGGGSATSANAGTSTNAASSSNSKTPKPSATPTHTPVWTTVQTFTGNGDKKTDTFSIGNTWKINWSCDPSSFDDVQYNIMVDVDNSDGSPLDAGAINTLCSPTNKSDTTTEHQGGNVYLDINSEAAWTMQIQEMK